MSGSVLEDTSEGVEESEEEGEEEEEDISESALSELSSGRGLTPTEEPTSPAPVSFIAY